MANGNGTRLNWDIIRAVAQYLIYPIAVILIYMLTQNADLDRRLSTIEIVTSRPVVDVESVRRIAVMEDRQNRLIYELRDFKEELEAHRNLSTYDPGGVKKKRR